MENSYKGSQPVSKPSFYKSQETAPNAYQQVSKNSARNRPNSSLQFLLASFYFPEPYCSGHLSQANVTRMCEATSRCSALLRRAPQ